MGNRAIRSGGDPLRQPVPAVEVGGAGLPRPGRQAPCRCGTRDQNHLGAVQRRGREREIVHCVACAQGCFDNLFEQKPVECLCNPLAGYERERAVGFEGIGKVVKRGEKEEWNGPSACGPRLLPRRRKSGVENHPIVMRIDSVSMRLPVGGVDVDLHVAAIGRLSDPEEGVEKIGTGVPVRKPRPVDCHLPAVGGEEWMGVKAASLPEGAQPRFRDGTLLHPYRLLKWVCRWRLIVSRSSIAAARAVSAKSSPVEA